MGDPYTEGRILLSCESSSREPQGSFVAAFCYTKRCANAPGLLFKFRQETEPARAPRITRSVDDLEIGVDGPVAALLLVRSRTRLALGRPARLRRLPRGLVHGLRGLVAE